MEVGVRPRIRFWDGGWRSLRARRLRPARVARAAIILCVVASFGGVSLCWKPWYRTRSGRGIQRLGVPPLLVQWR